MVPIHKKGDMKSCDNWRGISLLEVTGKVFGRILNDRLHIIRGTIEAREATASSLFCLTIITYEYGDPYRTCMHSHRL